MKLFDDISADSVVHEVFRICNANANTYPIRDIAARVNSALDRYLTLVFRVDGRWNFDDINESSPPIDTQSIVSGTNRYKFSAFTETLLSLIRLEILDADAKGLPLIPEIMDDISNFQSLYIDAGSGTPTHYTKYGDFIYLRPNPDYSETNGLLAYFNRPASKFNFNAVTITNASPAVFTHVAHGLSVNDTVLLQTDGADLPSGFSVDTIYYVSVLDTGDPDDKFQLAATLGGSSINAGDAGTGIHYYVETSKVPGIPVIHHPYLARYASLPYLVEKSQENAGAVAQQIQTDEMAIEEYFANRDKDVPQRLIPNVENTK